MNRQDLRELSRTRRKEANALLRANYSGGAYYLLGYSVECALKACIAKQTRRHDFPDRGFAQKAHVHNLENLLKLAGLEFQLDRDMKKNNHLELNWSVVKDWSEVSRYSTSVSTNDAKSLYSACMSRKNGILNWIEARW